MQTQCQGVQDVTQWLPLRTCTALVSGEVAVTHHCLETTFDCNPGRDAIVHSWGLEAAWGGEKLP